MSMADPILISRIEALLADFTRSGLRELHLRTSGVEIFLSHDPTSRASIGACLEAPRRDISIRPAPPANAASPATAPAVSKAVTDVPPEAYIVRAPNLGTFYGAPKPGAEAYVAVGSTVIAGSELCLIEVMKLFTALRAEVDGRIHAIFVGDGEMVEADQPLFAIMRT